MSRQVCVGCGGLSPETNTNYTLISSKYGWRLTRWTEADGSKHFEWRCPSCYEEAKAQGGVPPSSRSTTPRTTKAKRPT